MRPIVVAVAVGLISVLSPPALASTTSLQPGVHVDPGSPAGKEYQIPVAGARGETGGGGQTGSSSPPLFGVGVTPGSPSTGSTTASPGSTAAGSPAASPSAASSATRVSHSRSSSRKRLVVASSSPVGGEAVSAVSPPSAAGPSAGGTGSSGWIPLVAGGLLVLVLGGGGGLALRQRLLRS